MAGHLSDVDHAAAQALVVLAKRVDAEAKGDNVSLPTYLRLCEALRLTPASRGSGSTSPSKGEESGGSDGNAGPQGGKPRHGQPTRLEEWRSRLPGAVGR